MKNKNFILGTCFGIFISIFGIGLYLILPTLLQDKPKEVVLDQAVELIQKNLIKEANFHNSEVFFVDRNKNRYLMVIENDTTREYLMEEIIQANEENKSPIRYSETPQISNLYSLLIINALPYIILTIFLVLTLYWYFKKSKSKEIE